MGRCLDGCVGRCVGSRAGRWWVITPPYTAGARAGWQWEKGAWCVGAFATAYMMEKKPAAIKILV